MLMLRTKLLASCLLGLALAAHAGARAAPSPDASVVEDAPGAPCDPQAPDCAAEPDQDADPAMDAAPAEPAIDEPFGNAWLGAADADVTLVVFADYACPACRAAQPVIDQLLATDKRLKVVYRVLVNEENGRDAAMASLAVARSGADWGKFHRTLDQAGEPTAATIAAALKAVGMDPRDLPSVAAHETGDNPILDELSHNDSLIYQRNGTAVPAWVIDDGNALNGFELAKLQAAIGAARKRKAGETS
jgi:protein-disulfide isomerase